MQLVIFRMRGTIAAMSEINQGIGEEEAALREVIDEIEIGAASVGWDRPPSLYALVPTSELLQTPGLPDDVAQSLREAWDGDPNHLSAILQESLGQDTLEEMLPRLVWPDSVYGAAITVERVIVPPQVEAEAPSDPEEALEFISGHPLAADVRIVVGVTRAGHSWCEVRTKKYDERASVGKGVNLVPSLVEGLEMGFADQPLETDA